MSRSLAQWLQELRSRTTRTLSRRRRTRGQLRSRPAVEALESRLAPAALSVGPLGVARATVSFEATSGVLSLHGSTVGSSVQVAILGNGDVALTLNGQTYSSDPAAPSFDAALGGASAATLQQISLTGSPADSLTLTNVTTDAALTLLSDGGVTLAGTIDATGRLTVTAATVDVQGAVHGNTLALTTTGLLNVEAGGSLAASAGGNGGSIALAAGDFVNDGQVDAGGTQGGRVAITATDYLNAGLVSAAGSAGSGGQVQIDFTASYIDTATATTTANGVGSTASQVIVNGGSSGRLFSSGHFDATGTAAGSIELLGHDVLLVGAAVDASGTSAGGRVLIGGDTEGDNPAIPNAQTVDITSTTTVRADGGGSAAGGRVIVWSQTSTVFQGDIAAQGGGAGGFIEVSSHGQLTDAGTANAGRGGTLLLDPKYLVIQTGTGGTFPQFNLVNPGTGGAFGTTILTLATGNVVVTDPKVNSSKGAVYLFNGLTGALLSTLSGSTSNDDVGSGGVTALSNGNFVISSPAWTSSEGAATWGSGTTGVSGVVSSANSLVGSTSGDKVGSGGVIVLANSNYVVSSPLWSSDKGAATWGSGTAGVSGVVSSANSLIGSTAGDEVSSAGVRALANGNYVVSTPDWNNYKGAATWGSGTAGIAGTISATNSLVGSDTGSSGGDYVSSGGVTALPNGNYVVCSPKWNGSEGAATWGTGASGVIGVLSSSNSLVGNTGGSSGDTVGSGGVTVLTNGNYVVSSPSWNDKTGAATWASGTTGVSGAVSSTNSLVGSSSGDEASSAGVTALTNGNYVVASPLWDAVLARSEGAVTWGSGTIGISGMVSASNSIIGGTFGGFGPIGDEVGSGGVTALLNGNYVVKSPGWSDNTNTGAVTWENGSAAATGTVAAANSLVGGATSSVVALNNGNYVVCSPSWSSNEGAVTWGSGMAGVSGIVSASNSLVGSSGEQVGSGGVTALPNGDYAIKSPSWNNNQGAATWENGSAAATGTVSASNSLVGSSGGSSGDQVSSGGVTALPNGNFVVLSPLWNNSKGAATWGSGSTGITGTLSSANSIVGTTGGSTGDEVGSGGVTVLADGNFVVSSPFWNGAEGAVTWLDGTTGTTLDGQSNPDAANSLLGAAAKAGLGPVQLGAINGSFVAAFSTENSGIVTVGFVPSGGSGGGQLSYGFDPTQTITEPPSVIAETLAAGTNVVLQANDDITISSPITVTNPAGTPGNLTLQAGRSILLNAGITTDGGNLTLIANDTQADGVVDSQRDSGNAVITMTSGVILNTGGGALSVDLKTSTDKTNNGKGVVTLLGLTANSTTLSSASTLGITIDGPTPGDGVTVGTYTQVNVTGPIDLNGAPLQLSHIVATSVGETFTIVQSTGGISGTFAGLAEGATVTASDGTPFTISYQGNGGNDVVLTQVAKPTQLVVTTEPPVSVTAGSAFSLAVSAEDALGNVATGFSGTVTLALANNPGNSTLGGTLTVTASQGVATFTGLTLNKAGSGYTLQATSSGLSNATTNPFSVTAGLAAELAIVTQPPSTVTAGVAINPAVTVAIEDALGNVITTDNSTVTAALASGPGTLGGTTSTQASAGVATFNNLVLQTAGTDTLILSDASLPAQSDSVTTNSFTVNPAAANSLTFGVQPSSTTAGVAISPAVTVEAFDQFGNFASNDNSDKVTLTVASGPGGFTGSSTTTVTFSGGVATFSNLVLDSAGSYTLGESGTGGISGPASAGFTVSPASGNHLAFSVQPSSAVAGTAISPAVQVQVLDRFGNLMTADNSDQVTLTVASGPGGFASGSMTTAIVSGGIATFDNLVLDTAGNYTLGASASGGLTGPASASFTVSPATADHLAFGVPPSTTVAGVTISPVVTVKVFDQFGNLATNDNSDQVTLAVVSGPGGFTGGSTTTVTVSGGVASFSNLVLDTAGSYTLSESGSGGLSGPNSASFTVSPAAANHLAFGIPPSGTTAGVAISPAVTVQVFDQFGNLASNDNSDKVTLIVASGPGGFASGSTTTVTVSGGVATFGNLVLDSAGSYTLAESGSGGLSGPNSTSFTVNPAAANHLAFGIPPSGTTAGVAISPAVTVQVLDRFGNAATNDNSDQVTLAVASGPGGFASGSTTTVTVSGGIATFSNLVLDTAGSYTLSESASGGLSGPASTGFTVSPAAANRLAFGVPPGSAVAGAAISPAVTVKVFDQFGNLATNDNSDQVTLAVASGPGGFAGSSTTTVTVSSGVATFINLVLDTAGNYTLGASGTSGLSGPNSAGFTVSPAAANHLVFGVPPGSAVAGAAISPAVTVQVLDQFGNLATNDNSGQVTLAVASGPGGFAVGSTTTVTVSGGVATFSNLVLDTAGSYTLSDSASGGLSGPASAGFTVGPAAANRLAFGIPPSGTTAGVALSPAVTVKVFDRFGNFANNDNTDQVTLAVASGPGGFAGGSTTTLTVSGGVATFSNLVLDTAGSYTLGESASGGLSGPNSASFSVSPAAADQLAFSQQPSTTVAGVAINPAVTVQVHDQFGNLATNDNSDQVSLSVASGPGNFASGSITTATVSGGVATFITLVLDTAGSYTLGESGSGGISGPASASFTVSPASGNHLAFSIQPSSAVAGAAISPAVTVQVLDHFGNLVIGDNSDKVTLKIASGPGGFASGSTTTATANGGVATFSNLLLDTAGNYTLGASGSSGLTGPNSASFTVSPAAASHLAFGVQPSGTTAGVAISPAVTVKAFDQFGNFASNDNSDQVTLSVVSGPGGFASGSTTTVTVSGGVASFSNLVLDTAGSYTLGESATGGLSGPNSAGFTVVPAAANQLAFGIPPSATTAGVAIKPAVTVKVFDQFGNFASNDNSDKVTLAVASGPGGFTGSITTVTVSGGVATFSNLVLDIAGSYTLGESATSGLTGPASASFTVNPAAANHLAFGVPPGSAVAGTAIGPAVQVQVLDRFDNVLTGDNSDKVTLKVASGPGGFASGSTTTATVSGGVATFSNLLLDTAGSYTLAESATGGLRGPASASFTVVAAAANHLTFGVQPGKSVAGVAISPAVTVKAFDPFGNLATNDNSDQVTLTVASGPGGFTAGSTTTATVSGGVATFSNLVLDTAGSYTLSESATGGLTGPASASFTVSPAAANHLAFGVQPSATTAGVAIKPAVTVKVFDQFGNFASNDNSDKVTLTVASGPGGFTGSITTVTVSGGVATFSNLVLDTAGSYTLGESASGGISGPASASFAVSPAAANHLAFGVAPSVTTAGAAISPAVQVQVLDRFGNVVTGDNSGKVTLKVASGPGSFASGSTTTATASGGVATFSNLVLDTAGSYTLGESATGSLTGPASASFTVVPAAASHLAFGVQPGKSVAGAAISPAVTVKAFDQFGNLATNDNSDRATLAIANGPGGFSSGSTTTVTVSGGVATFSNLVLDTAGGYTLSESGTGGLSGPNSASFTVSPAAADHLAFSVQPSTVVAGVAISPAVKVQVLDRFGNLLTGDNSDKVTLKVASGPGSFASGSTTTVTVSGGVATFGNLVLDTAGSYTLGDSATVSLTGPNSASFTVNPAAANHLAFSVPPGSAVAGVAISPAVKVQVLDKFGNVVTGDNSDKVTLKVASGPGGFASGSTTTATVSGGIATFGNLVLDSAGSYTLGESASGGLTGPNSASFTVVPAAANHLAFGIQPSNSVAGVAIKPAVTVKEFDQFGNLATNDNSDQVTLAVASGPGGFTSGSTTTVTVSGGVATFSNLVLTALGSYTLSTDTTGDLTGPNSASFTVKP